ncbi:hypothetical protein HMPREF0519_1062 [Lentilactobacillus hilgardii DSM 20176 = ATCC 8290]|uniref:Uncharacterized protein n=1 Tax=Lentilactobacillus hilgardii (strain ATCC 8290 / DSM 20176 / CCUG 30140 / JCM 1155 / KCTC 3500 / NBRC 15886 / NCIMB 8040 / NRRL B-1843 / 9) TaxID=1423757 RepID=C0XIK1_LENH9|nr:hypothetical protein HMPREF0519_1062 [Lentilactobacillus hilgardii DSM 20176 = ATCC 8290]
MLVKNKERPGQASQSFFIISIKNNNHGIEAAWLLFSGLCNIVGSQGIEPNFLETCYLTVFMRLFAKIILKMLTDLLTID